MLIMKRGKSQITEGIKLQKQERVRTLTKIQNYKYPGILEAEIMEKEEMKEKKIRKDYLRKLLKTRSFSRNLIQKINTWIASPIRKSGPFLK